MQSAEFSVAAAPTRRNAAPLRRLGARGQLLVRKAQGADRSIVFA